MCVQTIPALVCGAEALDLSISLILHERAISYFPLEIAPSLSHSTWRHHLAAEPPQQAARHTAACSVWRGCWWQSPPTSWQR